MKRSTNRILTTHVGSLIRPPALQEFLRAKQSGKPYDQQGLRAMPDGVRSPRSCAQQAQAGIDVVSDGEFGKIDQLVAICAGAAERLRAAADQA